MEYKLELFQSSDGVISFPVPIENETVWLSQQQMAELFGKDRTVIGRHIRNAINEGEIDANIMGAKFAHMGKDGDQVYNIDVYNLEVTSIPRVGKGTAHLIVLRDRRRKTVRIKW